MAGLSIATGSGTNTIHAQALTDNQVLTLTGDDDASITLSAGDLLAATDTGKLTVTGGASANVITTGDGDDTIAGSGGADVITGGAGNDTFVFSANLADGATITDFAGNGASPGDQFEFHGFGTTGDGATFTFLDTDRWQIHSGLDNHNEIIHLTNTPTVHATDFTFS